jgi:putative peptide zinc metalloprotease protein
VAFQVVLALGDTATAVPQNVAVSLTSHCVNCLTYALAVQLFATLDRPLSGEARARLDALWAEIAAYGNHLQDVPLSEIQGQLTAYEQQIVALLVQDGALSVPAQSSSGSPSGSPSPGAPTSGAATPDGTLAPSDAGSASATPSGSTAGSTSPTSEASATASPSSGPSPTATTGAGSSASPTATGGPTATP